MSSLSVLIASSFLDSKANQRTVRSVENLLDFIHQDSSASFKIDFLICYKNFNGHASRHDSVFSVQVNKSGIYQALNVAIDKSSAYDLIFILQDDEILVPPFHQALLEISNVGSLYSHYWFSVYDQKASSQLSPDNSESLFLGPLGKHQGLFLNARYFRCKNIDISFDEKFKILGDINQYFRLLPYSNHYCSNLSDAICFCFDGGISSSPTLRRYAESILARISNVPINVAILCLTIRTWHIIIRLLRA